MIRSLETPAAGGLRAALAGVLRRAGFALGALALGAGLVLAPGAGPAAADPSAAIAHGAKGFALGAPPAGLFEGGGGPVREVRMDPEEPEDYVGVWQGPFKVINMRYYETEGGIVGNARLTIADVQGTLARGLLRVELEGEERPIQRWTGAFTRTGHIMVLNAHAIMFEQGGQRYIEADIQLNNGTFYRMRLSRLE